MDRKTLVEILDRAPGVKHAKNRYEVAEDHRVTFYLGTPGQAMVVTEVDSCVLEDEFLQITTRDEEATLWVGYDDVNVVADRASRPRAERRPGFS